MGSSNLLNLYQSKGRKKAKPIEQQVQKDYVLSVDSGPNLKWNLDQRRSSHLSMSSECVIGGVVAGQGGAKLLTFPQGADDSLRRRSESSLLDLTNSVEALTRCIETINIQKAANLKFERENQKKKKDQMEEPQKPSEAVETSKVGDFGGRGLGNFLLVQQVTTPAKLKLNQQGSGTASCKSSISNKSDNNKNNNRNISNANGDGDYIQPHFGNVRSRTANSLPKSRPSQLGPFLGAEDLKEKQADKQRSPPPIDSVTMIYKKSNEKPSIASIQVQQLDTVELNNPDAVAKLIESKAAPVKPPGLGLRTAIKIESEKVAGRQHGNLPGRSGTRHSADSPSVLNSLNTEIGGQGHLNKKRPQPPSNAAPQEAAEGPSTRKLKIRGLRNFVEKRRPGPPLWARQFPCRSKFHPDSYLYDFEGPTAPKRPVEAMSACRKKCGRCRACGVFSDNVCPECGNCPFDCKCPNNGFDEAQDEPGPDYFLSQILGSKWSQKQKLAVNNSDDDPQPIYPRSRNLNNITSSNNPLKISGDDSPVKPLEGGPPAPPVIATGYNTYAPASPGLVAPLGSSPYYPGYGYPYFTPGPPAPVMPMMYPPGMVPSPMARPPFYAPYPTGYPAAPGGVPSPYPPGPVY